MKYYFFYVSMPCMDMRIDLSNETHTKLISYCIETKSVDLTKSQLNKMRRLMKAAGLVDSNGSTGECSIHYVDLSFRECKYPTMEQNFEGEITCEWCTSADVK
tara:strand:+ start:180 stop:488 length:309 start_codon:yes stop_codon:yes gene_type:complete